MSKTDTHETALLALEFNNTDAPNIGDAGGLRGSVAAGSLYLSLHTADPGEAGNQSTSEVAYTGYARVAIPRSTAGFTVSGNLATNAALVQFGLRSDAGAAQQATHFGLGTASSGAGTLRRKGPLASGLSITQNVQPEFPPGELDFTED